MLWITGSQWIRQLRWNKKIPWKKTYQDWHKIKIMNKSMIIKEDEFVIKNFSTKKILGLDFFTVECYQTFKGEVILIYPNSFRK